MQIPLQITLRNMAHSDALETRIRSKVADLERFHPRITSCRIAVIQLDKHQHQGRQFEVRVELRVPGHGEIVVTRQHAQDVYVALRDAVDAAARQLEDVIREQRGDVKKHEMRQHGTIARLISDEGYGFIETSDGRELYFSRENVVHPSFESMAPGMTVQFIEAAGDEGAQAKRVSSGKHGGGSSP